ncbi:MAG TPA: glycosyl hydrolase family 28-related protein, partial [Candidatus Sulfotelmatobacter sp.]|nr:glycosyl hydrolase family 28-related protein [Candidatus Sulfotelmatobacter sp.]
MTIVLMAGAAPLFGASSSVYSRRLEDPQATYLTADRFPVHADGKGDDSVAIQQAIDRVQETTGQGILFIPSGQYRLTRTLFVWPGIRLIGYGPTRPVFVLADDTPGFQTGPAYMVFFAGFRPGPQFEKLLANRFPNGHPPPTPGTVPPSFVPDANPGTFYSAMSNID